MVTFKQMQISVAILPTREICITILKDNKALAHINLSSEGAGEVAASLVKCIEIAEGASPLIELKDWSKHGH